MNKKKKDKAGANTLVIAALGVVYGDIGTSPLYTLQQCFASESVEVNLLNVLGFVSLIFWAILLVVTLKYVTFVMRADSKGEGGIMVLMQEAKRYLSGKRAWAAVILGLIGSALFYGDAVITPAISLLSAMEGLIIVNAKFTPYVLPLAIVILITLFAVQKLGTEKVGSWFGPIMGFWFITIGILGLLQVIKEPLILQAINPYYAYAFVTSHGWSLFLGLGAVVLALTGAEALYADMGHFGRKPIRLAWFNLVLPCLCLNYFGQGALLLSSPASIKNPFYLLAPEWALLPFVILATLATIIASQAVISGAYSLSHQAMQLGFSPRLATVYTNEKEQGQIYIPAINKYLLFAVLIVMLVFKNSGNLAAAYGIAVTGTMIITSLLFYVVMVKNWHWSKPVAIGLTVLFLSVDLLFFSANLLKVAKGGWLPIVIATGIFLMMLTWWQGRQLLLNSLDTPNLPLESFISDLEKEKLPTVQGTAIFLTNHENSIPSALIQNLEHNKVLHERVVFLTIRTLDIPFTEGPSRVKIDILSARFIKITADFGFMETPTVKKVYQVVKKHYQLDFKLAESSFFVSNLHIFANKYQQMSKWRLHLFLWLNNSNIHSADYFKLPYHRVVELGRQIDL